MVVIGHSMGGILSRLMVSSSGDVLWKALQEYRSFTPEEMAEAEAEFGDMMRFEPSMASPAPSSSPRRIAAPSSPSTGWRAGPRT